MTFLVYYSPSYKIYFISSHKILPKVQYFPSLEKIINANNMTFNVLPCSNATPHPTQLKRQVDCHRPLIVIVGSYLFISVSCFGCLKTSSRIFRCLLQSFLCDYFSCIFGAPSIFDLAAFAPDVARWSLC